MKKRQFCNEIKRVVYTVENDNAKTSYCKLDCIVDLSSGGVTLPWELTDYIRNKYPNIVHKCCDTFSIHIETKATCHEKDVFDEKRGKTIAYSKAQLKLYRLLRRIYADMENYFSKQMELSKEVKELFSRYRDREFNFLEKI